MQTRYYATENFIRHTDNVVDLTEYRRRLEQARQEQAPEDAPAALLPPAVQPEPPRRKRLSPAAVLDLCASVGVVLMTLAFTLQILVF